MHIQTPGRLIKGREVKNSGGAPRNMKHMELVWGGLSLALGTRLPRGILAVPESLVLQTRSGGSSRAPGGTLGVEGPHPGGKLCSKDVSIMLCKE